MQRDVPEPTFLAFRLDDERRAFIAARVALGALPVGPQRGFLKHRVPFAQAEAIDQKRALSAGIDNDLGMNGAWRPIRHADVDADRPLSIEKHFEHAGALVDLNAVLARVFEQHLIEFTPLNLPRLR